MEPETLSYGEAIVERLGLSELPIQVGQTRYDKKHALRVRMDADAMKITDLKNAFLPGRKCEYYKIQRPWGSDYCVDNVIRAAGSLFTLFKFLQGMKWVYDQYGSCKEQTFTLHGVRLTAWQGADDAKRTYSPLHLHRIEPLRKHPKKWTVPLAVRALVNGQFTDLRCSGRSYDDQTTESGPIARHVLFARRILQNPSGWWANENGGRVSICCYSFDSNEFKFCLDPRSARTPLTLVKSA